MNQHTLKRAAESAEWRPRIYPQTRTAFLASSLALDAFQHRWTLSDAREKIGAGETLQIQLSSLFQSTWLWRHSTEEKTRSQIPKWLGQSWTSVFLVLIQSDLSIIDFIFEFISKACFNYYLNWFFE